jgi:RNA polymerase sigma-70 factor (ECF subfamily)
VDPQLVERARRGDRDAFDLLMLDTVDGLYAIARLVAQDVHVAEDAVQEALVRCWRDLPTLRDPERFEAWLRRLVVNAVADEFRKTRRFAANVAVLRAEPSVGDQAEDRAERDELERAFRVLSLEHRAVIVMFHYIGLSIGEAASSLGVPPGTVKSRLHYALRAMRATLEAEARNQAHREASA